MAANTKIATAVQILCVIAYRGNRDTTAEHIAQSLATNPVLVRRVLKRMEHHHLVAIRQGKAGGVRLARAAANISLAQIYAAVEGNTSVFALRPPGNPACPVDRRMGDLLTPVFGAANAAVDDTLGKTTLATLVEQIA